MISRAVIAGSLCVVCVAMGVVGVISSWLHLGGAFDGSAPGATMKPLTALALISAGTSGALLARPLSEWRDLSLRTAAVTAFVSWLIALTGIGVAAAVANEWLGIGIALGKVGEADRLNPHAGVPSLGTLVALAVAAVELFAATVRRKRSAWQDIAILLVMFISSVGVLGNIMQSPALQWHADGMSSAMSMPTAVALFFFAAGRWISPQGEWSNG